MNLVLKISLQNITNKKPLIMKKFIYLLFILPLFFTSCSDDDDPKNETSIIPSSFQGRSNEILGHIDLLSKNITISVWDHGKIDGDIISIYVNGDVVIAQKTLDGPGNKFVVDVTLKHRGYNYMLLYAHNEGSISPNTCAVSINDGSNTREFILEANLDTNGTVDLYVD